LREAFRRHQWQLKQPVNVVLVARPSIVGRGFAEVERDYLNWLRRASLLRNPDSVEEKS
jgi:ribonuclease P protein component